MFHAARTSSVRRRTIAVAFTVITVFALAVPTAFAAAGYARAGRHMALSGDRTYLRTNLSFNNTAKGAQLGVVFGQGNADSMDAVGVFLRQNGTDRDSRSLTAYTYSGEFSNVQGHNCVGGSGVNECPRSGFDWVEDRPYRVAIERGGHNENGWLWTLRITDMQTLDRTPLLSFRSPYGQLSTSRNFAALDVAPADCDNINAAAGVVTKPRREDGTAFAWGTAISEKDCSNVSTYSPIVDGNARLRVTQ